jgi:hypothetical protein
MEEGEEEDTPVFWPNRMTLSLEGVVEAVLEGLLRGTFRFEDSWWMGTSSMSSRLDEGDKLFALFDTPPPALLAVIALLEEVSSIRCARGLSSSLKLPPLLPSPLLVLVSGEVNTGDNFSYLPGLRPPPPLPPPAPPAPPLIELMPLVPPRPPPPPLIPPIAALPRLVVAWEEEVEARQLLRRLDMVDFIKFFKVYVFIYVDTRMYKGIKKEKAWRIKTMLWDSNSPAINKVCVCVFLPVVQLAR